MLVNTPEDLYKFMAKNIKYGFYSSLDCQTHTRKESGDEFDNLVKNKNHI